MEEYCSATTVDCGTTSVACEFEGGVMFGAYSKTSLHSYVDYPFAEKFKKITDNIYCYCNGTISEAQAITDLVAYYLGLEVADWLRDFNEPPIVYRVATLYREILRANEMKESFIVAGWDIKLGGQVYTVPTTGVITRQNCAVEGSGSSYLLEYVRKKCRANMKKKECITFMRTGLSLAMAGDLASRGIISIGILEDGNPLDKMIFTQNGLMRFYHQTSIF